MIPLLLFRTERSHVGPGFINPAQRSVQV